MASGENALTMRAPALTIVLLAALAPAAAAQTLRPSLEATTSARDAFRDAVRERVYASAAGAAAASLIGLLAPTSQFHAGRRADYEAMVAVHAKANDVPEHLVHRVIVRESKYQPNLIGRGGTIGMMQIKLGTARGLGYGGTAEQLRDPQTNLQWGVKYLAGAWRAAHGNADLAVRKYAAGYYERKTRNAAAR